MVANAICGHVSCDVLRPFVIIPQTVLALRGSNGVGFRVCLLILRQPVDGRADHQTLCICSQSRCHTRLVQARRFLFSNMLIFTIGKQHVPSRSLLGQPCAPRGLESWIFKSWNLGIWNRISLHESRISLLENRTPLLGNRVSLF